MIMHFNKKEETYVILSYGETNSSILNMSDAIELRSREWLGIVGTWRKK